MSQTLDFIIGEKVICIRGDNYAQHIIQTGRKYIIRGFTKAVSSGEELLVVSHVNGIPVNGGWLPEHFIKSKIESIPTEEINTLAKTIEALRQPPWTKTP